MNIFFQYSSDENMIPTTQLEDTLREHIFYVKKKITINRKPNLCVGT